MKEIDTNKDGQISFEEFAIWWKSGAKTKLEPLVYLQLKGLKLVNKVHSGLTRLGSTIENRNEEYDNSYIALSTGDTSGHQMSIHTHIGALQKDLTHRNKISTELMAPSETEFMVAIVIESNDAQKVT